MCFVWFLTVKRHQYYNWSRSTKIFPFSGYRPRVHFVAEWRCVSKFLGYKRFIDTVFLFLSDGWNIVPRLPFLGGSGGGGNVLLDVSIILSISKTIKLNWGNIRNIQAVMNRFVCCCVVRPPCLDKHHRHFSLALSGNTMNICYQGHKPWRGL